MSIARRRAGQRWAELAAGAALCAVAALTVLLAAAYAVLVLDLEAELRRSLGFGFAGVERSPATAAGIAFHNGKFALGLLACALAVPHLPRWARPLLDLVLGTLLVINAGMVGVALAAYGDRALVAVAAHLPLEFAALSLAGGAYLAALHRPLRLPVVAAVGVACGVLLCGAAVAETYVQPGAGR